MVLLNFLAARASIETTLHLVATRTTAHLNVTNQTGAHAADVMNSVRVFVLLVYSFIRSSFRARPRDAYSPPRRDLDRGPPPSRYDNGRLVYAWYKRAVNFLELDLCCSCYRGRDMYDAPSRRDFDRSAPSRYDSDRLLNKSCNLKQFL